jgi:hypothetical protein
MAREQRVVTPDGHVWYVRRRWAKRRPPWARQTARFDAEAELAAEKPVVPPLDGLFSYPENDLGEPGFDVTHDERAAASMMLWALLIGVVVVGLLVAATVRFVVPWLIPLVVAFAWPILGVAAGVAVLVVVDRLQRPWFVELQRQGLADAPRRLWRVQGWRRSGQLMKEIAGAVREGRIATDHTTIVFPHNNPRPPHH